MGGLIERTAETSAVRDLLARAREGRGSSLLLRGAAGIGRSAVVEHAQEMARESGFTVLSAFPTPVSSTLPLGLVHDWLGPLVRAVRPGAPPFDGPAAELAEAMAAASRPHPVWNLAALDHAVTWALESLCAARPVLLTVDDVQWLDAGSLQLLDLVSARVRSTPLALVLALRGGEPTGFPEILERLASRAVSLELRPLTVAGLEQLRHRPDRASGAAPLSAEELHRLTGGIPFLAREILRSDQDGAPAEVVDWLHERLGRLGEPAVSVARATAVLGHEAELDAVAALTDLDVADLADPLAQLHAADVLEVERWRARPAHPVLAEALLRGLSPSQRSHLHQAAAAHLGACDAPAEVVAGHLLHTVPREDPAVVELLRAVGRRELEDGAPDVAARLLVRAASETRPEDTTCEVLGESATACLLAGRPAAAFELWTLAVDRAGDAATRAGLLVRLGDARMAFGHRAEASDAYTRAEALLAEGGHGPGSPELSGLRARRSLVRAWCDGVTPEPAHTLDPTLRRPAESDTHTDRQLFALAALDRALCGNGRAAARGLALRALGGGLLLREETADGTGFYTAPAVLSWADAHAESLQALNAAVKDAHQRGSVPGIATATSWRGLVHLRQGRLRQARGDFQAALGLRAQGWPGFAEPALAGAALTRLALGQDDDALALETALRAAAARGQFVGAFPLAAAGLIRATYGDHEHALKDYRRAGRLMGSHPDNGSIVEWRELSVWSLKALGRLDEARDVALEATHHARVWGAPRGLGIALRALAQVSPRDEAVALLREAADLFDAGTCVDHRARAWTDLARLLLDGDAAERDEAVALLRRALAHGRADRVPPVVLRATRLLVRAGEQVSDPSADPAASLTPGERRVVELAASGHTNRQIAQKLFVTVKAVEWHLSNAYRKLTISSRAELAAALYGESGPRSSSAR
jgi:DNA-binding CsgD family transcriptional regulator